MAHAQDNPIPGIEEDDLAEIKLDEVTVGKLREVTLDAIMKVKVETKAQRLADAHGAYGWKTVSFRVVIFSVSSRVVCVRGY